MPTVDPDRRLLLASAAGLSLATLSACHRPEPLVRLAGNAWVGYAPLFLARELGYFSHTKIRLLELPSNSASLMALASGQVEVAALTLDEVLVATEGQLDLQVIMVFDESAGADVVMVRPDITRLEQLRGRRIAVESTASGALMLARTLDAAGLRPQDVVKVPLAGAPQVSSYASGEVDAVVSFEPFATQLARLGAVRLVDSRRFPGVIVDVLAARSQALADSPGQFRQLLAGYFQALERLQKSPQQAAELMSPALGISAGELLAALQGVHMMTLADNHHLLGGASPGLRPMAQGVADLMLRSRLLTTRLRLDTLTDARYLPPA